MRRKKGMRQFIREHRADIDAMINENDYRYDGKGGRGTIPDPPPRRNDHERELYILNYEPLYRWARNEGVRI